MRTLNIYNPSILGKLGDVNLNRLKAKEVRQYANQKLKPDELNNIKAEIVGCFRNEVIAPIVENLTVKFAFSEKKKQFQGLLDTFITLNVFANLILREGYTLDDKNQFEGMVEDFCEQFNSLVNVPVLKRLNKDKLIRQIAVLNTHSHDHKPTEAFKRIKAQIAGKSSYNKEEFISWKSWISGADKEVELTDSLKTLIVAIDKILQKKDFDEILQEDDSDEMLQENDSIDEATSKLLPKIQQNSKVLLSLSSKVKGDLSRRLRIFSQLEMAGINSASNHRILTSVDFDFKVQKLIANSLSLVVDDKLIEHHAVNYTALIAILKAHPELVNMEIVTSLLDNYEINILDNGKGDIAAIILKYLRGNPKVNKTPEFDISLVNKLSEANPKQIWSLIKNSMITDFRAINNFIVNYIIKDSSSSYKALIEKKNMIYEAAEFMLDFPILPGNLGFEEKYKANYNITLLNLLSKIQDTAKIATLLNNYLHKDNVAMELSLESRTNFTINVIVGLRLGHKFDQAIFDALVETSGNITNNEDELVVYINFLKTYLSNVMQRNGIIFKLEKLHTLFKNLNSSEICQEDNEIRAILDQLSPIVQELNQIHEEFITEEFDKLNARKERYRAQDKEFYIYKSEGNGNIYINYNNFVVEIDCNNEAANRLFENHVGFNEIFLDQSRNGGNLTHFNEIKAVGLPGAFDIRITPTQITSNPQINPKVLIEAAYMLFNQNWILQDLSEAQEYDEDSRAFIKQLATTNAEDLRITLELNSLAPSCYTLVSTVSNDQYATTESLVRSNYKNDAEYQRIMQTIDQAVPIKGGKRIFVFTKAIEPNLLDLSIPKFLLTNKNYDHVTNIFSFNIKTLDESISRSRFAKHLAVVADDKVKLLIEGNVSDTIAPAYVFSQDSQLADHIAPEVAKVKAKIEAGLLDKRNDVYYFITLKNENPKYLALALNELLKDSYLLSLKDESRLVKLQLCVTLRLLQALEYEISLPNTQQEAILRHLIARFNQDQEELVRAKFLDIVALIKANHLVFSPIAVEQVRADNNDIFELAPNIKEKNKNYPVVIKEVRVDNDVLKPRPSNKGKEKHE
jgi:hypothetical protein